MREPIKQIVWGINIVYKFLKQVFKSLNEKKQYSKYKRYEEMSTIGNLEVSSLLFQISLFVVSNLPWQMYQHFSSPTLLVSHLNFFFEMGSLIVFKILKFLS